MGNKFLTMILVAITGLVFFATGALIANDVPDEISIENQGYKKDKKGPVKFNHKKHNKEYKVACAECHHNYKDGKNIWKEGNPVRRCSECHNPVKKDGKVMKLKNSYHKKCKTCHKALKKEGKSKKAPFKKCKNCHAKKAR